MLGEANCTVGAWEGMLALFRAEHGEARAHYRGSVFSSMGVPEGSLRTGSPKLGRNYRTGACRETHHLVFRPSTPRHFRSPPATRPPAPRSRGLLRGARSLRAGLRGNGTRGEGAPPGYRHSGKAWLEPLACRKVYMPSIRRASARVRVSPPVPTSAGSARTSPAIDSSSAPCSPPFQPTTRRSCRNPWRPVQRDPRNARHPAPRFRAVLCCGLALRALDHSTPRSAGPRAAVRAQASPSTPSYLARIPLESLVPFGVASSDASGLHGKKRHLTSETGPLPWDRGPADEDASQHGNAADGLLAAGAAMPRPCCADGRSRLPRSVGNVHSGFFYCLAYVLAGQPRCHEASLASGSSQKSHSPARFQVDRRARGFRRSSRRRFPGGSRTAVSGGLALHGFPGGFPRERPPQASSRAVSALPARAVREASRERLRRCSLGRGFRRPPRGRFRHFPRGRFGRPRVNDSCAAVLVAVSAGLFVDGSPEVPANIGAGSLLASGFPRRCAERPSAALLAFGACSSSPRYGCVGTGSVLKRLNRLEWTLPEEAFASLRTVHGGACGDVALGASFGRAPRVRRGRRGALEASSP